MVASTIGSAAGRTQGRPGGAVIAAVAALAALSAPLASPLPAAASTSPALASRTCASQPAPQPLVPDIPWPQRRYEYSSVRQITDGSGVTVAVIDSGVDAGVPQLAGAVERGADMLGRGGDGRQDCVGHGTAVASIIAGARAAGVGLQGLAPGVRILPVRVSERVENSAGAGTVEDLAAGIQAAIAAHPRPGVINLSISTTEDNPLLRSAVRAAIAADIVVVAAVGNEYDKGDPTPYPASYDGVVGVGAIGPDGLRVASSQVGPYVDITAPGSAVIGDVPGQGQQAYEGTSFAAPFVAATAALIRARYPRLHQADVVTRLLATADPAPGALPSPQYGYGVVNPVRALTALVSGLPGRATFPGPVALGPPRPSSQSAGLDRVVGVLAVALVLAAILLAAVAAAVPAGRRRRWRPGQPVPTLPRPTAPAEAPAPRPQRHAPARGPGSPPPNRFRP
ncbi:MAG: S8 family serine peptidase [Betaproteobacteria bacterium]